VPFVPRSFDVWTLEKVGNLVSEIRTINPDLKAYTFINRADPKGQDNNDAAEVLKETDALTFINIALGMRKAFSNAAATGLAVTELKPKDAKATRVQLTKRHKCPIGFLDYSLHEKDDKPSVKG
jgi:chromosome partitioning protein